MNEGPKKEREFFDKVIYPDNDILINLTLSPAVRPLFTQPEFKNMKIVLLAPLIAVAALACAQAKECDRCQGAAGAGKGGMPADFRDTIHGLFAEHGKIRREVTLTKKGYQAETVSDDAEVAAMLQAHVAQMESRLEAGQMVRHWDPAFAELVAHYPDLKIRWKKIDGGVASNVSGKTPEAIKVAQNHARILSEFVEKGPAKMHDVHAAVVGEVAAADNKPAAKCAEGCATTVCEGEGGKQKRGKGAGGDCCRKEASKADDGTR